MSVGESAGPFVEEVTPGRAEAFAAAVGAPRGEVPSTYLTRLRHGEFELFQRLGIPLERVLHGEQEYEFDRPLRAGDRLSYSTRITSWVRKRGDLSILVFETSYEDGSLPGARVALARTTIVVRGQRP